MNGKKQYWKLSGTDSPATSIEWNAPEEHTDFIEMSGLYASFIVTYGVKDGGLFLARHTVFPMLRLTPNNTHASFRGDIPDGCVPVIYADGEAIAEKPLKFTLDGTVCVRSACRSLLTERVLFPCTDRQAVCELIYVRNNGTDTVTLSASFEGVRRAACAFGCRAVNIIEAECTLSGHSLPPGESVEISVVYSGRQADETTVRLNAAAELAKRRQRVAELMSPLRLTTSDGNLDTLFAFCKLRAGESVFRTRGGDVHSPGGKSYYAAVWCNDQVEYSGPWFAYTGDRLLTGAAYTAYSWYFPFMDSETYRAIPSSVIAEGNDNWHGAGDRGDAAMYLYGASRFILTSGMPQDGGKLYRAVKWCAEYCVRHINGDGVIESDSDELEGRLPSGRANLSTNMLAYGGFRFAARIAGALGDKSTGERYSSVAARLGGNCEKYFARVIRGFDTYRYYEGNETLRSWICLPLCMDIFTHAGGTARAIMSPYLMCDAGQLSEEGTNIAWDRSTLYGLRGVFRAGLTDEAYDYLVSYCADRLLSAHVPYPVEAWPEGGMRHLSGESALFCQIITEGMLGIDPLGFDSFALCPHIPARLGRFALTGIHAFGEEFDFISENGEWTVTTARGRQYRGSNGIRAVITF